MFHFVPNVVEKCMLVECQVWIHQVVKILNVLNINFFLVVSTIVFIIFCWVCVVLRSWARESLSEQLEEVACDKLELLWFLRLSPDRVEDRSSRLRSLTWLKYLCRQRLDLKLEILYRYPHNTSNNLDPGASSCN